MDEATKLIDFLIAVGYPVKRGVNGNVLTRCPAHADSNPSLSVKASPSGRLLLKCFAGCSFNSIMAALKEMGYDPRREPQKSSIYYSLREADNTDAETNKRLGLRILQYIMDTYPYLGLIDHETISYIKSRNLHMPGLTSKRICHSMRLCSSTVLWRHILQEASTSEIAIAGLGWWRGQHMEPCSALKPHRMVIPYLVEGKVIHFSSRAIRSEDPIRYASPPGWGSEAYPFLSEGATMAIIVEGEIKAGLLHYLAGLDTIAIPGVDRAHKQVVQICRERNLQPFILFDKEPNPAIWRAQARICNEFQEHSIMALPLDLPVERSDRVGRTRVAPDDLLLEVGREEFERVLIRGIERALAATASQTRTRNPSENNRHS
jgi:hypothetical protein